MDDEAFERLAHEVQPRLLRLGWVLTADPEQARDLVQETLVRAFVHKRRVAKAEFPYAYLRTTLLNVWRSQKRRPVELVGRPIPESVIHDAFPLERAALREALAELPPRQRAVVALRHLDDLSVRQTAEILGCSPQTVTTQCARALARLSVNPILADFRED